VEPEPTEPDSSLVVEVSEDEVSDDSDQESHDNSYDSSDLADMLVPEVLLSTSSEHSNEAEQSVAAAGKYPLDDTHEGN